MTANEMKLAIENQLDIVGSFSAPEISDEQASQLINDAIFSILKRIISEGVEFNEYNRGFVAPLKRKGTLNTSFTNDDNHLNGTFWQLPNDVFLILQEECIIDKRDCFTGKLGRVNILPVTEDYVNLNIKNFEKRPYFNGSDGLVWRILFNKNSSTDNKISELLTSGSFNVSKYKFRYLTKPKTVVVNQIDEGSQVNSEIWEEYHQDIINVASLLGIEELQQQERFQTKAAVNAQQGV
jgi:hypothetical protein